MQKKRTSGKSSKSNKDGKTVKSANDTLRTPKSSGTKSSSLSKSSKSSKTDKSNKLRQQAKKLTSLHTSKILNNKKKVVPFKPAKKASKNGAGIVRFEDIKHAKIQKELSDFVKALVLMQKEKAAAENKKGKVTVKEGSKRASGSQKTKGKYRSKSVVHAKAPQKPHNVTKHASKKAASKSQHRSASSTSSTSNNTSKGKNKSKQKHRPKLSLVKK